MIKYVLPFVFVFGCAHQPTLDPNAVVCVSSQYENEPENFHGCGVNFHKICKNKRGAECSAALYNNAQENISEAVILAKRKLYLSASLEYMQALSKLTEAEIRLNNAKLSNFADWQIAVMMGLETKIKKGISVCERRINRLKWMK